MHPPRPPKTYQYNDLPSLNLPFCGQTQSTQGLTDRDILAIFYESTNGPNWVKRYNWLSDRPLGEWFGVTTDSYGRVTKVRLLSNNLTGEIPAQVGDFTNLTYLHLRENRLSGKIPPVLGHLVQPNFFVNLAKSS